MHLRLKSIYKAFKQSGATLNSDGVNMENRPISQGSAAAALARAAGFPNEGELRGALGALTPDGELR